MNILFIASSGGTLSYHLTRLAIALRRRGHEILILSGPREQVEGLFAELENLQIEYVISNNIDRLDFLSLYRNMKDFQRVLKIREIDVIHANGATHTFPSYLGTKSVSADKKPAIVTSIHSIPRGVLQKLKWGVMITILNKGSDIILPVSDYTRKQLIEHGLNAQKLMRVYNAIDLKVFDEASKNAQIILEKNDDEPTVVYVANLTPVKGHEYYLMAAARVLKNCKANFYIIGDGPRRLYLQKLAHALGIEKNVVFTGRIHWPKIYYVLSNMADVCVSSSLSENFPFYIIECMAARKPLVATNVGGVSEAIIDGINGFLVQPKDSISLAEAILKLVKNPEKAKEMGLKGRQIVEKHFSMDLMVHKIEHIYESVL